jgi:uncharacterized protein YbjT (DUF2867 family)
MKIFVLGGTGVIGSRVVPRLRSLGHEVTLFPWRVPSFGFAGHDAVINLATHIPPASRALLPGRVARHEPAAAYAAADSGEKRHPALDRYNRGVADAEAAVAAFPGTGIVLRFGYFYGRDSDFTQQMIGAGRPGCRARRSPLRRRHRARPTSSSPPAGWGVVTITSA